MAITLEPVALDFSYGDDEGMLALNDGRVFAVLTRLSALHDDLVGRWFVEVAFARWLPAGEIFPTLPDFVRYAVERRDE